MALTTKNIGKYTDNGGIAIPVFDKKHKNSDLHVRTMKVANPSFEHVFNRRVLFFSQNLGFIN
jgi:hypothetical protein